MVDHEKQSIEVYNKLAGDYANTFDGRFTRSFKAELVSNVILRPNDAVLDVACGTGELLSRLNQKCPIRGVGIDIAPEMIKVAQAQTVGFEFIVSSCAPLPFDAASFDVITVSAAFHHFPEPRQFAREAFRVLKQGGRLYVAELYLPIVLRQIANLVIPFYRAGDVKIYHPRELVTIFGAAGFSGISIQKTEKIQLLSAVK